MRNRSRERFGGKIGNAAEAAICGGGSCAHYMCGGIGERACALGVWDERVAERMPRLNGDAEVLRPAECGETRGGPGRGCDGV